MAALNFSNGNRIPVYTNGNYYIVNGEERIDIYDENIPDMSFEVSSGDTWIIFRGSEIEFSDAGEYVRETHIGSLEIETEQWGIMLLDTEAEIFITRNWNVFRIPFRSLLQSRSKDYLRYNPEFLGNYTPSVEERVIGIAEIMGKEYEIDRL